MRLRSLVPYLIAPAAVGLIAAFKTAILPYTGDSPFVLFSVPTFVASALGGLYPGLFSAVLSAIAAKALFLDRTTADTLRLGLFVTEEVAIAVLWEWIHRLLSRYNLNLQQLALEEGYATKLEAENQALESDRASLIQSDEIRSHLARAFVHSLGSPLSIILLSVDKLMRNIDISERDRNILLGIRRQAGLARKTTEDLLTFATLSDRERKPQQNTVNLEFWLNGLVTNLQLSQACRGHQVICSIQQFIPVLVTDSELLEKAIAELLTNAFKYSFDNAPIQVSAVYDKAISKHVITVINPGLIPGSEMPKIFTPFYRIPKGDPFQQGGSGLGLAIVKGIARSLGGSIECQSEGGVVTFRLKV